nr:hypothetical protein [Tanacetum cinerariifolium]
VNPDGQQQSSSVSSQFVTSMLNPSPDAGIDSFFESTPQVDVQASTIIAPLTLTAPTLPHPTIPTISLVPQAPTPQTTSPITFLYMDQRMDEAVKVVVLIQSDRLRDEAQAKNEEFLNNLDENIQKIIKDQVKEQVKVQVSKILPKIEKTVNEQLEAEVLTRLSNSSNTSYAVATDLSEMELKNILIEKMESNKSIHRSNEQRNLYKTLVDAYESDKIILDTYGYTVTLKRRRDDADKDEEPSAGSDRGSKRRREGKDPESTSNQKEKATKTTSKSTQGSKSHQKTASESAPAEEPMQTTQDLEEPSHQDDLAKQADSRSSFNELMDTPVDFSAFLMNRLKVDTLTPELLAGQTYELMKRSYENLQYPHNLLKPLPVIPNSRGRRVIPFDYFINKDLEYLRGGASSRKYINSVTKTKAADYGHIKWIEDLVPRTSSTNLQSTGSLLEISTQVVEWHNNKHLDWITVRKDDDKLYKFKEGDFKRLRIQDIEDMFTASGSRKVDKSHGRRTLCFQRLSKNVHKKHRHPTAYERSSTRASAMIQAIDKQLKMRRIMRSLEKFVGGRLYEGDFRSKSKNIGIVPTEMELILEQTQQSISHKVSVDPHGFADTMDGMNIPANDAPAEQAHAIALPTRTDDQNFPLSKWVPIGKSNCVLDVQKTQRNPIFPIDLDEQWFNLHKDIIRDALDITPTNDNNPYVAPPLSYTVIEYINTLGYLGTLRNVSTMFINALFQPWRAILSMINMCLTEFVQSIQTFLTDRKNLATALRGKKRTTHLLILNEHVAKYQQYLDAEHGKADEEGATESLKATKGTKPMAAKATKPGGDKASTLTSMQPPKPKPAPTQPSKAVPKKKRKLVKETTDEPSSAKRLKGGLEPAYNEEEANLQQALELSLKEQAERTQGPARPVVIREPDSGRIQLLLDVKGKGKEKRRTPMLTEASGHAESPSLDAELALTDKATDASTPQNPEQMDEEFTTTAYPNVQENLKLPSEDPVILDEPASSTGTLNNLSSHDNKNYSTTTSTITKLRRSDPIATHCRLGDASFTSSSFHLPAVDMKEILQQRISRRSQKKRKRRDVQRTPSRSPPPQPPPSPPPAGASGAPGTLEALGSSQLPHPPPPSTGASGSAQQQGSKALSSSKSTALAPQFMAWSTSDTRYKSAGVSRTQELSPTDSLIQDDSITDEQMNPEGDQVRVDVNRPLPLGGPPCHDTIQTKFFFNKDLEYLRYGSKGSSPALSISKMKAASYPDFGLELLVPEQMWIDDVHASPSRRKEVRSNMQILSVVGIKAYSRYGDFEDLNLLLLQGHLDHLPGSDKQMLSTAVKLWTRNLVIRQRIKDFQLALAYIVKEFKIKRLNPGMNTRFWIQKDMTRSKEFIAAIKRRLETRRIYRNLECFVGGRVRDIDYRLLQRTK